MGEKASNMRLFLAVLPVAQYLAVSALPFSASSGTCTASTISLSVRWPVAQGADLYAVHLAADGSAPFLSQTSPVPTIRLVDLNPDTRYTLTLRSRTRGNWTDLVPLAHCSTRPLKLNQAWVLSPQTAPTTHSMVVALGHGSHKHRFSVQYRQTNSLAAWSSPQTFEGLNGTIDDMQSGTKYQIRARLELSNGSLGPFSDVVEQRTADLRTESLDMYRISEMCGNPAEGQSECEPDLLQNHDSGELLADVDFITEMANGSGFFIGQFNTSVTTAYCVERVRDEYADYASCNGPDTENYKCTCNIWFDRCIGQLDTTVCNATDLDESHMPSCKCSEASLARSSQVIGRMPVYTPFASFPPLHKFESSECFHPPGTPTFLGYWYSMPKQGECDPIDVADGLPSHSSCSWARRSSQHFVQGAALTQLGFNSSLPSDVRELKQNSNVVRAALNKHRVRCCGC